MFSRKKIKSKKTFVLVAVIIIVFCASAYSLNSYIQQKSAKNSMYQPGKGGDPTLVSKYHDQAVEAWKAGDRSRAKDLAEKGRRANDELTIRQQAQVPDQADVLMDLYTISKGIGVYETK